MYNSDWTLEETTLLIQKRLEMFGCARSDKVYDKISSYLYQKYNICQNPSACQSRFNNVLKTYRLCAKRLADDGSRIRKMRFPFFDIFHQYYAKTADQHNASGKCKSEFFLDDIIGDNNSYAVDDIGEEGDSIVMDSKQTRDETELEDLKLRLMEQKLLYYTNQNMLLLDKQEHYRRKEQERTREQSVDEEIPKVLRGIHSCLARTHKVKLVPPATKKAKVDKRADSSLVIPIEVESDDEALNRAGSSEEVINKPAKARLKVRKNIFPAWNRTQTVLLIKIHCDLRPKFKAYNLFECISNKLIELHINRAPRDCRTRWNNLFRSYKECRTRLQLNDKAAVKFEYFDEIDAYYKDKPFLPM